MPLASFPHLKYWLCGHCSTINELANLLMPLCLILLPGFPPILLSTPYFYLIFRLSAHSSAPPYPVIMSLTFSLFQWQDSANQPMLDNLFWPFLPFPPCHKVILLNCCSKASYIKWVHPYDLFLQLAHPFSHSDDSPFASVHKIMPIRSVSGSMIIIFPWV